MAPNAGLIFHVVFGSLAVNSTQPPSWTYGNASGQPPSVLYSMETVDGLARKYGHFEDLFHDPLYFEKFLKQIGEGRYTGPSKAKLSVYLHPILVNSWNDEYLRRKKRESQLPAGPAYEWPAPDKAAYVKAGGERLKEPCQGIIRSRNIEDLPWKDVAIRCDLTEGYVKTKHKECLEALRTILDNPRF